MLKKVILGIVVGAIVLSTSAGFLYAYQGEPGGRQDIIQQSSTAAENDGICTNEDCPNFGENCPNYGENCPNYGDCENCQNYQNCQGFQNQQENSGNSTGTCLNNGEGNKFRNSNGNTFNMQNAMRNRFRINQ